MKIKITTVLLVLLFITCSKENTNVSRTTASTQNSLLEASQKTTVARIPINDLGTGLYMGYTGGLYPGGANSPSGVYADDLYQISSSIVPLDTFGKASSNGKIAFMSLGASIGGKNMKALITKTKGNPLTNPKLLLMNGNEGGVYASLASTMNPDDPYWLHVSSVLKNNKSSYRQTQVIYLETDLGITTNKFPERPNAVKNSIEASAKTIKQKFPNAKVLYLLARTRTFNNHYNNGAAWNVEPCPYYFGWACKWAIEDQINGVPGTGYKGANVVSPIVTWGFYQWADSLPRKTDDFYWRYSETKDGLHSNDTNGQDTLATRFQNFLLSDVNARQWYANPN